MVAVINTAADSQHGSWQDRLLEASHVAVMNGIPLHKSKDAIELFGAIDNTSSQCPGFVDGFCVPCPDDKPLWWLVLRWLKMMLYKIARSYTGKPLLLMILPLSVGLFVGYSMGRTQSQQWRKQQYASKKMSFFAVVLMRLRDWISVLCLLFFLKDQPCHLVRENSKHDDETCSSEAGSLLGEKDVEERLRKENPSLLSREERVRIDLKSDIGTNQESGVDPSRVPRHVAVIMDGNRRYGKEKYGNATRGHWDGSSKLVDFAKWCIAENVSVLTVYAFSTENWNRPPDEVAALMSIFARYCDELRVEALKRNIRILVLSTEAERVRHFLNKGCS
jgi:hypothetical protein